MATWLSEYKNLKKRDGKSRSVQDMPPWSS